MVHEKFCDPGNTSTSRHLARLDALGYRSVISDRNKFRFTLVRGAENLSRRKAPEARRLEAVLPSTRVNTELLGIASALEVLVSDDSKLGPK
jgi:hypothetical protein